jgi:hypothetical protein
LLFRPTRLDNVHETILKDAEALLNINVSHKEPRHCIFGALKKNSPRSGYAENSLEIYNLPCEGKYRSKTIVADKNTRRFLETQVGGNEAKAGAQHFKK